MRVNSLTLLKCREEAMASKGWFNTLVSTLPCFHLLHSQIVTSNMEACMCLEFVILNPME